ncbi:hypothetical protein AXW83_12225 [Bosea sp. PAMC 26642]|nr:hypothetical protein AXW83_12225 [Bosea sp. PAMC 26642]
MFASAATTLAGLGSMPLLGLLCPNTAASGICSPVPGPSLSKLRSSVAAMYSFRDNEREPGSIEDGNNDRLVWLVLCRIVALPAARPMEPEMSDLPPRQHWTDLLIWMGVAVTIAAFAYLGLAHQWRGPAVVPGAEWSSSSPRR